MPRAGSASTRAESVFVDEELFTVLAALVCLHLVQLNLLQGEIRLQLKGRKVTRCKGTAVCCNNVTSALLTAPVICIYWHGVVVDLLPEDRSLEGVGKAGS